MQGEFLRLGGFGPATALEVRGECVKCPLATYKVAPAHQDEACDTNTLTCDAGEYGAFEPLCIYLSRLCPASPPMHRCTDAPMHRCTEAPTFSVHRWFQLPGVLPGECLKPAVKHVGELFTH